MKQVVIYLCAAWATASAAWGHGVPIVLSGVDGRLLASPDTVTSEFETFGVWLATDLPGFGIVNAASGIDVGSEILLEVIDRLWYWDPAGQMPARTDARLTIENTLDQTLVVDQESVLIPPPLWISQYNGSAGWHRHVEYALGPDDAPLGAYGVVLRLLAAPLEPSNPVLVVFGFLGPGFGPEGMSAAVTGLKEAIFALQPGDANRDGIVDLSDFRILKAHFGATSAAWGAGDFDGNRRVDLADFNILKSHFGAPSTVPAPEPGGALLALCGAALFWRLPRRGTACPRTH